MPGDAVRTLGAQFVVILSALGDPDHIVPRLSRAQIVKIVEATSSASPGASTQDACVEMPCRSGRANLTISHAMMTAPKRQIAPLPEGCRSEGAFRTLAAPTIHIATTSPQQIHVTTPCIVERRYTAIPERPESGDGAHTYS